MNKRAMAYLKKYSVDKNFNGVAQPFLPLDRLQGFLDLLQPGDVPPEKLQQLYEAQATAVERIRAKWAQKDNVDPSR